jgi:hypothetical protein
MLRIPEKGSRTEGMLREDRTLRVVEVQHTVVVTTAHDLVGAIRYELDRASNLHRVRTYEAGKSYELIHCHVRSSSGRCGRF